MQKTLFAGLVIAAISLTSCKGGAEVPTSLPEHNLGLFDRPSVWVPITERGKPWSVDRGPSILMDQLSAETFDFTLYGADKTILAYKGKAIRNGDVVLISGSRNDTLSCDHTLPISFQSAKTLIDGKISKLGTFFFTIRAYNCSSPGLWRLSTSQDFALYRNSQ